MSENNIQVQEQAQAPAKESNGALWAALICITVGLILALIGYFMLCNSDMRKYYKCKDYTNNMSSESVTELYLEIGWADLKIEKSPDDKIYVDAKDVPEDFEASLSGSTFRTDFGANRTNFVPFTTIFGKNRIEPVVTIQLPDKDYKKFTLELGAGDNRISGIKCTDLEINCGAGEVNINQTECERGTIKCGAGEFNITNMNCKGRLDIDGGAGEINITDSVLGGLDLDQGVGEFNFKGTVNGDIDADGGVGEITFNLENPESDFVGSGSKYKLDIDTGIGSKTVNYNVPH